MPTTSFIILCSGGERQQSYISICIVAPPPWPMRQPWRSTASGTHQSGAEGGFRDALPVDAHASRIAHEGAIGPTTRLPGHKRDIAGCSTAGGGSDRRQRGQARRTVASYPPRGRAKGEGASGGAGPATSLTSFVSPALQSVSVHQGAARPGHAGPNSPALSLTLADVGTGGRVLPIGIATVIRAHRHLQAHSKHTQQRGKQLAAQAPKAGRGAWG